MKRARIVKAIIDGEITKEEAKALMDAPIIPVSVRNEKGELIPANHSLSPELMERFYEKITVQGIPPPNK